MENNYIDDIEIEIIKEDIKREAYHIEQEIKNYNTVYDFSSADEGFATIPYLEERYITEEKQEELGLSEKEVDSINSELYALYYNLLENELLELGIEADFYKNRYVFLKRTYNYEELDENIQKKVYNNVFTDVLKYYVLDYVDKKEIEDCTKEEIEEVLENYFSFSKTGNRINW